MGAENIARRVACVYKTATQGGEFDSMTLLKTIKLALAVGISSSFMIIAVPDYAQSQTLFELLFQNRNRRQFRPRPVPTVIKKVSAPKYFGYRTSPINRVKLSSLVKLASVPAAIDTVQTGSNPTNEATTQVAIAPTAAAENQAFLDAMATLGDADIKARKDIGKAVVAHYVENPDFFWIADGEVSFKAQLALSLFSKADDIGLNGLDYLVALPASSTDAKELARFELTMSIMAVRYALDARNGKINPNKLSGYHDFPKIKYSAEQAMAEMTTAVSASGYLASASPNSKKFMRLRKELAALKLLTNDTITIADGTLIKPGKSHEELPNVVAAIRKKATVQLLQRHGETLTGYSRTTLFDADLVALVKDFQKEVKLKPDGVVGRNTISKLVDVSPQVKINRVELAMERLRWHPRNLGSRHVFVNQPAYRARYIQNGEETLSMRAIVGKRSNQTSFFHDTIERVEFNPYWGVPQSIIINEMLPKLRADPSYLDARGYEVTTVSGQKISSSSVDWYAVGGGQVPYNVRQLPGSRNALGELKILFPNKHAIYMHDTPSRGLFKRTKRALSHGCVRLQNPRGMAAAVLGTSVSTIASKINLGKNNGLELKQRIPVYIAYFTAWPNKEGDVEYFYDMYGRDKHLSNAMAKVSATRDKAA